jgi:tight adherence protein C
VISDHPLVLLIVFALLGGATLWLVYTRVRSWAMRQQGLQRIDRAGGEDTLAVTVDGTQREAGWLTRWLALAGYRRADAPLWFGVSMVGALGAAVPAALLFRATALNVMIDAVANIPGGIGEAFVAILGAGPWILLTIIAASPILVVRAARRRRVRDVEQDLSLTLELFATLAEAGLGFDAALARVVQAQPASRPLTYELIGFQRDLQAGSARLQALRHLADRIDVTSMTIFVSAIIQSEQVGSSLADTLRHQADDLRARRREQALILAQSLPVKLVFPLVVCFLPGIFLSTIGPVLFQMIEVADSVLRSRGR